MTQDRELTPDRARFLGAHLRGFSVDVQFVDGEWLVGVTGLLILGVMGKRTSVFNARGADPEKAVTCAMAACRRAYGSPHVPILSPYNPPPPQPPKAG